MAMPAVQGFLAKKQVLFPRISDSWAAVCFVGDSMLIVVAYFEAAA